MSETVLDGVSVGAGSSASGTCAKQADAEMVVLAITGFDSNSTNLDVTVSGAAPSHGDTVRPLSHNGSSYTGVDATGSGAVLVLDGLEGVEVVEVTVTNNAASATTLTVVEDTQQ